MDKFFRKYLLLTMLTVVSVTNARPSAYEYRQLPTARLTLTEWPSYNLQEPNGPGTYAFGYELEDAATGNVQFRDEERLANGTVRGSFGHVRPDGLITVTKYVADDEGYRSDIQTYNRIGSSHPSPVLHPTQSSTNKRPSPQYSDAELEDNQPSLPSHVVDEILGEHQIDIYPTYNPATDPELIDAEISSILGGNRPIPIHSKDTKDRFSLQLVNNFIPSNFPIITFQQPSHMTPAEHLDSQYPDPETVTFVNDKFHDPIFDIRKNTANRNRVVKKKVENPQYSGIQTKEARWFKEFIRSRRKEYLQKYASNYDLHTIPANYVSN